jgi:hypothetical protein
VREPLLERFALDALELRRWHHPTLEIDDGGRADRGLANALVEGGST